MSTENKRGRGRPAVDSDLLRFRAGRDVINGIEAAAADDADAPSRSEKIRRIVTEWLVERGYLPKG